MRKNSFANKKVLITGGLGFIGSNLAHRLVGLGAKVMIVDAMIPNYGGNWFNIQGIKNKVRVNIADISNESSMIHIVKDHDYIFNLAGQVSHLDSMVDPYTDLDINARAQLSVLEACRKSNPQAKIVFAGTRQVYGKPQYLPVNENHPVNPTDINGVNKLAGEWFHIMYHNVYGLHTTSLRLTNTYGPRQLMKHNRQGFVYWFTRQALDGEEIKIFGDGQQKRDLNYVDDVVEAMLLAAASPKSDGEIFNLGHHEPVSLLDLTKTMINVAGKGTYTLVPFPPEKKSIDIGDYYADFSKITSILGWKPKVSLEEGLKRTMEYYRKNKKNYWD